MLVRAKWSVDDYHRMIDVGILCDRQVELISGEIIEVSPEGPTHRFISVKLVKYLKLLLAESAEIYESHPITLIDSEPEPDIAIVKSPDLLYRNRHPQPEEIYWLIEIADKTLAKDKQIKQQVYAVAGIKEYWIIDVKNKELIVYRNPDGKKYQQQNQFKNGIINPISFPDLNIEVNNLLNY